MLDEENTDILLFEEKLRKVSFGLLGSIENAFYSHGINIRCNPIFHETGLNYLPNPTEVLNSPVVRSFGTLHSTLFAQTEQTHNDAVLYSPIITEFPSLIYSYPEGGPLCPNAECPGCRINNECPDPVHRERYVRRAVRPLMIRRTLASRVATCVGEDKQLIYNVKDA
ncbi:hypothetical protein CDAR_97681 [Caerostris darwini]|uniref:Uncharacterized protein n=1 Tax=Caerostris darwini TaxID=1538125 RepID=A0AAV4NG51_9ARAC|nr:hypothetical protein CDAR_97681 [Caerostris darwini]